MRRPRGFQRGEESRLRRIPEEWFISALIADGPPLAMYDIGVGCFNEFRTLKRVWPAMKLYGCEPCPEAWQELLPIFDGQLLQVAIGKEDGKRILHMTPAYMGGSTLYPDPNDSVRPQVEVDTWTLDRFDRWAGEPDKILLWMDIEGAELEAVAGGARLLSSGRVKWINTETRTAPFAGHPTTAQMNEALGKHGFYPVHRYNQQGAYPEAAGDVIYFHRSAAGPLEIGTPYNGGAHVT